MKRIRRSLPYRCLRLCQPVLFPQLKFTDVRYAYMPGFHSTHRTKRKTLAYFSDAVKSRRRGKKSARASVGLRNELKKIDDAS